jgi:hypothetical protein
LPGRPGQRGERGLQEALDRIYPEADYGAVRINIMTSSHAIGFQAFTPKTVPYQKDLHGLDE